GIRDRNVTGVQTCALPIFGTRAQSAHTRGSTPALEQHKNEGARVRGIPSARELSSPTRGEARRRSSSTKTGEKLSVKIYEESLFCLCKNTMKCVIIRRDHFTLIIRFLEKGAHIVQLETALQQHFGYSSFRSGQKEIIETI